MSSSGAERNDFQSGSTTRCSSETSDNHYCTKRTVSDGGDLVVFSSKAPNLVAGDSNGVADVFLWRRQPPAGQPNVISLTQGGDGASEFASISPNGEWVAFESRATNLPAGDGYPGGSYVGGADVYVYRVSSGATYRANIPAQDGVVPNGNSLAASVADNGVVAFESFANNLVPEATSSPHVYVNRAPSTGGRAEVVSAGGVDTLGPSRWQANSPWISAAGDKVVFSTYVALDADEDLTTYDDDVFVRELGSDPAAARTRRLTADAGAITPSISPDGETVAFARERRWSVDDDTYSDMDIYRVPAAGGTPTQVNGCSACSDLTDRPASVPAVADDGTVTFQSAAPYFSGVTREQVWMSDGPRLVSAAGTDVETYGAGFASVTADGDFVAFTSAASNLVPGDFNGDYDVFLWDRSAGTTIRVNVGPGGVEAAGFAKFPSFPPGMSADGRVVAFESDSTNLVAGDTNGVTDIFVRAGGTTTRIGAHGGGQPNGPSVNPVLSGDGRLVVFTSMASNLSGAGDTNGSPDVYLHNRSTGVTTRVSTSPFGEQAGVPATSPSISPNGAWIAFQSAGPFDPTTPPSPGVEAIYRYRVSDGTTQLVTRSGDRPDVANARPSFDPSVADNGSVAFTSRARNLTLPAEQSGTSESAADDIFVVRADLSAVKVSVDNAGAGGDDDSSEPAISADGQHVAFTSLANNLVGGPDNAESDVFVRSLAPGTTRLVSAGLGGAVPSGASVNPAINANGSFVAFSSKAENLVPTPPNNNRDDVFVTSMATGSTAVVSRIPGSETHVAHGPSYFPAISASGRMVAFHSQASNFLDDRNIAYDTFLRDLGTADGEPFLPVATVADSWAREGTGAVTFTVSLSPAASSAVAVTYRTDTGTATAADFGVTSGTAHFAPGQTSAQVTVAITGDALVEPDETFFLTLTDASGAVVGGGTAKGTILDDDRADPTPDPGPRLEPSGDDDPDLQPPSGRTPRPGYWMLGADGKVYRFGEAGHHGEPAAALGGSEAVDLEPMPSGEGYWVLDTSGRIFAYGDAVWLGNADLGKLSAGERITSLSGTPTGRGYWVFTSRGRVLGFGDAHLAGDVTHLVLAGPVLDSVATPSGRGYYMVASDGGIFAFGDAEFIGSMGGKRLNAPVQSLVPDADGRGYWLVASDGGIFAFEAAFKGSMGATPLNRPVTGMVRFGGGYLMVGEDGGIFDYSGRAFLGSLGANPPARPIVAVAVRE